MKLLFAGHYNQRYTKIIEHLPPRAKICELCPGDFELYINHISKTNHNDYLGLELNESFLAHAKKRSIPCQKFNLLQDTLPGGFDVLIMQGSLYQFTNDLNSVLIKIKESGATCIILSESIRHLANSKIPLLSRWASKNVDPGTGQCVQRFNQDSFKKEINSVFSSWNIKFELVPGERDIIAILNMKENT